MTVEQRVVGVEKFKPVVRSMKDTQGRTLFSEEIDGNVMAERLTPQQIEVLLQANLTLLKDPACQVTEVLTYQELLDRTAALVQNLNAALIVKAEKEGVENVTSFCPPLMPKVRDID